MDTKLPTKPAAKTSKLCPHALNGGCHFGAQCHQEHPRDVEAAKLEQSTKKTLNLCGFFASPSGCTKPGCTFLHVALAPKATASGPSPSLVAMLPKSGARPGRQAPPTGATPSRPAQKGAPRERKERGPPRERRGGKGPAEPRREERKVDEPEAFRLLHCTRGKLNTLRKVAESYRTLHSQLPGGGFLEKAEQVDAMLAEITEKVKLFNSGIDQYIVELGQKVEEDDGVSVDEPEKDRHNVCDPPELELEPDTDGEPDVDPDADPEPDADGATALLTSGCHL